MRNMTCRFLKFHTAIGTTFQTMCEWNWKYVYGVKKDRYMEIDLSYPNLVLYEMAPTLKGPLTLEGMSKINRKPQRLSI
jgi:hypothetical protein